MSRFGASPVTKSISRLSAMRRVSISPLAKQAVSRTGSRMKLSRRSPYRFPTLISSVPLSMALPSRFGAPTRHIPEVRHQLVDHLSVVVDADSKFEILTTGEVLRADDGHGVSTIRVGFPDVQLGVQPGVEEYGRPQCL